MKVDAYYKSDFTVTDGYYISRALHKYDFGENSFSKDYEWAQNDPSQNYEQYWHESEIN